MKLRLSIAAALCAVSAMAEPPSVRTLGDPARIETSIELPSSTQPDVPDEKLLSVAILDEAGHAGLPLLGTYTRENSRLIFRPRFPLAAGARYRIQSRDGAAEHSVPAAAAHLPAIVTAVHPQAKEVPANLLKFYLHFSRPMREGREVFTQIHLLDGNGRPVDAPWRDTELWTADARRLTLWIHPGRVKRGVNLREDLGPVLRPGETYTLVVEGGLRDADGQPIGREFRHAFRTGAEINARLDLADWELRVPAVGTRDALRVVAPRPIDHALALRGLHIRAESADISGEAQFAADERTWMFVPTKPWRDTPHDFVADPWLEDLAGNTFARVFDDDVTAPVTAREPRISRSFTPASRSGHSK